MNTVLFKITTFPQYPNLPAPSYKLRGVVGCFFFLGFGGGWGFFLVRFFFFVLQVCGRLLAKDFLASYAFADETHQAFDSPSKY